MFPHTDSLDRDTERDRTLFLCCLPSLQAFRQSRGHVASTITLPGIDLIDKRTSSEFSVREQGRGVRHIMEALSPHPAGAVATFLC